MGWANSSVRHPDELPDLGDLTEARGIVREDPPEAALWGLNNPHRESESTEVRKIMETFLALQYLPTISTFHHKIFKAQRP